MKERGSNPVPLTDLAARVANMVPHSMDGWMGPQKPLQAIAQQAEGRQFDFPVGYNLRMQPRSQEGITFQQLRTLADSLDILRLVIETRKDEIAGLKWAISPIEDGKEPENDQRCAELELLFKNPDREHGWDEWLRMLLEDLIVLDAPAVYIRKTNGGKLYALEPVDGATIKRVIDETGRTPMAPDPAYQQILKGLPAVDYTTEELIYKPRNPRTNRVYGYSPVEQVIMTINIALNRQLAVLSTYTEGNIPAAFIGVPDTWQPAQIAQFQLYWDGLMEGDVAQKRRAKFVPGDIAKNIHETQPPPLKDEYDEWIARIVCFAFSISPTPFIRQLNRSTAETSQDTAEEQGLVPYTRWIKNLMDNIIQVRIGYADLEFTWVAEDDTDPLAQAQVDHIYLQNSVISPDEVRGRLGLMGAAPEPKDPEGKDPEGKDPKDKDPKDKDPKDEKDAAKKSVTITYQGWKL